jgi:p-aminobenzoyl-glutamate transporter AbgT
MIYRTLHKTKLLGVNLALDCVALTAALVISSGCEWATLSHVLGRMLWAMKCNPWWCAYKYNMEDRTRDMVSKN